MTPVRNLLAICAISGFRVFSPAEASEELSHDIAAQPLAQALSEFATQTGLQVVYVSGIVATRTSKRAPRGLPAADALQRLLADTGLRFEFLNDRTVRIFVESSCALPSACTGPPFGAAALASERASGPSSPGDPLEEVLVTGARWWLDPAVATAPVTVLNRRDIERGGKSSIGDVLQALPMTTGSPLNTNANAPGLGGRARRRRRGRRIRPRPSARSAHGRVAQWPASPEQRSRCRRLGRPQHAADVLHRARRGAGERRVSSRRCGCRRRRRQHRHAAKQSWARAQRNADDHRTRRRGDHHRAGGDRLRPARGNVEPRSRLRRAGRCHDGSAQLLRASADHRRWQRYGEARWSQ